VKKVMAILLCINLLTQCLAHLGIIGYYQINKDYIAKNLCENKNKPQMKCCGKCYLKKQLKKLDENDNSSKTPQVKIEKNEVITFILPQSIYFTSHPFFATSGIFNPIVLVLHDSLYPSSVFHPPARIC